MDLINVSCGNIYLLKTFLQELGPASKTFRYFNKRPVKVINKHLITLLAAKNKSVVAYGHLDKEDDKVWLGICVLPQYWGKGYGNFMMSALIRKGKNLGIDCIFLTVDKDNFSAISLYEKFKFKRLFSNENYFEYQYKY